MLDLWSSSLDRMKLTEPQRRAGGSAMHIKSLSTQALWLYLYNNSRQPCYQLWKALLAGPQLKAISQRHRDEFIAQGHPREVCCRHAVQRGPG